MPVKEYSPEELQKQVSPDTTAPGEAQTPDSGSFLHDVGQAGVGAAKGLLNSVTGLPALAGEKINSLLGYKQPESVTGRTKLYAPSNTAQSIGRGVEQAGEFLIPGLGEEGAVARAGRLAPLARIGYNAATTGLLNKAQGGGFGTGALLGGGGSAVGQGLAAAAPKIAESAIGITKNMRGFGKSPGKAIIEDTGTAIRPSSVAENARATINKLNPQIEQMADEASLRPATPVRGFLPAPKTEIPLHVTPGREPLSRPSLFPAEYQNALSDINADIESPHYLSGSAHPELSGRIPVPHGTLIRDPNLGLESPILPSTQPNRTASLLPARNVISGAQSQALREGARTSFSQLQPMATHLSEDIGGAPIGEDVTARKLLDMRRGFNKDFGQWNPETHEDVVGTGRRAYHELTGEFHRVLPESEPLDQRISNLIPVVKAAESTSRNPPFIQRTLGRIGAQTGALAGAGAGAYAGGRRGGVPGAILGGTAGLLLPELIATPEGRMIAARMMASPTARNLVGTPIKGAALQLNRKDEDQ
jgi:hypothetical protein